MIADKDNTRPETKASTEKPVFIRSLVAKKWNGYNEIQWVATHDEDTRKFIVEYSTNGIDFQSAGEKLVSNNQDYLLHHKLVRALPPYAIKIHIVHSFRQVRYRDLHKVSLTTNIFAKYLLP